MTVLLLRQQMLLSSMGSTGHYADDTVTSLVLTTRRACACETQRGELIFKTNRRTRGAGCACAVQPLLVLRDIRSPLDIHVKPSQRCVVHQKQRVNLDPTYKLHQYV